MLKLAIVCHVPVCGSHISASDAAFLLEELFGSSLPRVPPVTSTFPSGSKVALCSLRPPAMDAVYCQTGVGLFRSIISAVAVGSSVQVAYGLQVLPPMISTFPSSYMTDDPQ